MRKVICTICCFVLLGGCSWFEDKRVNTKPKVDIASPEFKRTLSVFINQRYKPEVLRQIEADKAYQEYLLGTK